MEKVFCRDQECAPPFGDKEDCEFCQDDYCIAPTASSLKTNNNCKSGLVKKSSTQEFIFDNPEGYAAAHTKETVQRLNARRKGRPFIRYDIIKRDGMGDTVVISDITFAQLQTYRSMAEKQGNKIW